MAGSKASRVDQMETLRRYSAAILLAIMIILNLIITPNFFSIGTLWNVITQSCTIILTGMGMTMVISTGGIDISVGAVMALSGMVSVKMLSYGVVPAIIAALLVCLVSGLIAGFMVGKLRVQSMVVTLALMIGVRGVAQILNDAKILYMDTSANADMYKMLGSYKIGGLFPIQLLPIVLSVVVVYFILEKTILGRHIQATGDNPNSATLAGINTGKTLMFVYMSSAFLAALAGVFATAKIGAADGNSLGELAELDAIAAVAVGGTSMSGGRARVFGSVIGALIMQLITIMVNMNNITYEYAQVFKAIIIIVAVYIQREKVS